MYRIILYTAAVSILFLTVFPRTSSADVIKLKDGTKIEGKIIAETDEQVVIQVGGKFKTIERSKIESIKRDDEGSEEKKEVKKKTDEELEQEKKKRKEKEKKKKDRTATKKLYDRWQRARIKVNCSKCKAVGGHKCRKCKGTGKVHPTWITKEREWIPCKKCEGDGLVTCKSCKGTGCNPTSIKTMFWEILDPGIKKREGVEGDMKGALEKGVETVKKSFGGFTCDSSLPELKKEVSVDKNLQIDIFGDWAVASWKCVGKGSSTWSEKVVFHKVDGKWYWALDKSPKEAQEGGE
ncbi:MAG: hypothetical protein E3J72_05835 [Planctomycetota bacterium]|nr:MAG: hypothetical protein E3J72_05835 [Planctomycetota bacterium]